MSGEFVEVAPYSRVVFTWGWELQPLAVPPASTRVEVSLLPDDGATVVRIAHMDLPGVAVAFHQAGWEHYAERLKLAATGEDLDRDNWVVSREFCPRRPERPE
jgi:uncharacterized protein YndB with AHSA1/START domain